MRRTLSVQFRILGDLCYLSHRQTLTMWQRLLSRCGFPLSYSSGFNPHPRLSLPLPRPVGVQSDEEWLIGEVEIEGQINIENLQEQIKSFLPLGCEVVQMRLVEGKVRLRAEQVEYLFVRSKEYSAAYWDATQIRCSKHLMTGVPIPKFRKSLKKRSKTIDLQHFVEGIIGNQNELRVRCRIDPDGSVRLEELMEWLGIQPTDLAQPPCRTSVAWIQN